MLCVSYMNGIIDLQFGHIDGMTLFKDDHMKTSENVAHISRDFDHQIQSDL